MREIEQVMIYLSSEKQGDRIVWSLIISKTKQSTTFKKRSRELGCTMIFLQLHNRHKPLTHQLTIQVYQVHYQSTTQIV